LKLKICLIFGELEFVEHKKPKILLMDDSTRWWSEDTVAVVTGANKGIGFEIARQLARQGLRVVLTARDEGRGKKALEALNAEGLTNVAFHTLNVGCEESAHILAKWLFENYGGINILVN
jgi:carbonyl reductase 1